MDSVDGIARGMDARRGAEASGERTYNAKGITSSGNFGEGSINFSKYTGSHWWASGTKYEA